MAAAAGGERVVAGRGDAAGVETTTRHAFAAPRRRGSIPALDVRRHSPTRHHPPVSPRILMESGACRARSYARLAWAG
jgi:hypothetical protein